jgi:hypothetical protein
MNLDELIKKIIKFFTLIFWLLFFLILILWYSENKNKFFPQREVPNIKNPINPFK